MCGAHERTSRLHQGSRKGAASFRASHGGRGRLLRIPCRRQLRGQSCGCMDPGPTQLLCCCAIFSTMHIQNSKLVKKIFKKKRLANSLENDHKSSSLCFAIFAYDPDSFCFNIFICCENLECSYYILHPYLNALEGLNDYVTSFNMYNHLTLTIF